MLCGGLALDKIEAVANMIVDAKKVVVFTGAGISTESGIPDFRSPGGTWEKFDPDELTFQKFLASEAGREHYWKFHQAVWPPMLQAQPNPGHIAIAELHRMGKLDCCITQNVDGLHHRAGLPDDKVIELHGTIRLVSCLSCGRKYPREEIAARLDAGDKAPRCDSCKGYLKPATIAFGQSMPEWETLEAQNRAGSCDVFIVGGSSLVVYPAASMPGIAKRSGARLVIINLSTTPYDHLADVIINDKTGPTLHSIVAKVKEKINN
jgi:NAD-dependent deacetylase